MALTRHERERIKDNRLKIQAISESLHHIDPEKVPDLEEIQECLEGADRNLSDALRKHPTEP